MFESIATLNEGSLKPDLRESVGKTVEDPPNGSLGRRWLRCVWRTSPPGASRM